jgi:hypothetical protein
MFRIGAARSPTCCRHRFTAIANSRPSLDCRGHRFTGSVPRNREAACGVRPEKRLGDTAQLGRRKLSGISLSCRRRCSVFGRKTVWYRLIVSEETDVNSEAVSSPMSLHDNERSSSTSLNVPSAQFQGFQGPVNSVHDQVPLPRVH